MRLQELEHAAELVLRVPTILYRVQRTRSRAGSVTIGPLRLPPRGLLSNRFDLANDDVAYFAEMDTTAVYETLARRETTTLSLSATVAQRQLLTLRTTQPLALLDLRGHAHAWPVLQSLRYAATQSVAASTQAAGYQGIVYRSAQQYGADCYAIFGIGALKSLRLVSRTTLVHAATGSVHRVVAGAVRGSKVPLVP